MGNSIFKLPTDETINFKMEEQQETIKINAADNQSTVKLTLTESGGGGTTDYTELLNKPQINDVTLNGNKTLEQLGIDTHDEINNTELLEIWNSIMGG